MKTKIILFIMAFLSVTINNMNAQSTTGRKIEKTGEAVEKGVSAINKLFKKKDRDKTENQGGNTQGNPEDSTPETTKDSKNTGTGSANKNATKPASVNSNTLKPGDVHPDAVVLDVDELFPFYEGVAIVRKGASTALINSNGKFIVPFNTYDFEPGYSANGFFPLKTIKLKNMDLLHQKVTLYKRMQVTVEFGEVIS